MNADKLLETQLSCWSNSAIHLHPYFDEPQGIHLVEIIDVPEAEGIGERARLFLIALPCEPVL